MGHRTNIQSPEIWEHELDASIHAWIVSGEFRAWRRRTAHLNLNREPMRSTNGRILKRCSHPGCTEYYQDAPLKRTTCCRKHAMLHRETNKRIYDMAPCAHEGCSRMIYSVRNRTGFCMVHARSKKRRKAATHRT